MTRIGARCHYRAAVVAVIASASIGPVSGLGSQLRWGTRGVRVFTSGAPHSSQSDAVVAAGETIVGRAIDDERAFLLTDSAVLIEINPGLSRVKRHSIKGRQPSDRVWGLARLADGTLWTLLDRTTLGRLTGSGEVVRRLMLTEPHFGLFGLGMHLVYQTIPTTTRAIVLTKGPPGNLDRQPFGTLRLREFDGMRAEVWAANLVSCGATRSAILPCWFPDQPVVDLIDSNGVGRQLSLKNLRGSPLVSSTLASNRPQPLWDALVTGNEIWVVSSAATPPGSPDAGPLRWRLFRYALDGRVLSQVRLASPPRVILGVSAGIGYLLTAHGRIERVEAP